MTKHFQHMHITAKTIRLMGMILIVLLFSSLTVLQAQAAPLRQTSCTLPATVTTAAQLGACITEANTNGASLNTITLGADITLSAALPQITSTIVVEGASYAIDGDNSERIFSVDAAGDLTINQITVQNGVTDGVGGGIYNAGTLTVTSSTIANNSALGASGSTYGGGIYNDFGTLTVIDSTISGNYADTSGGGIGTNGASSTVTVTNSTISGNSADVDGGGIYNLGTLTVTYSTLADNNTISSGAGNLFNIGTVHLAGVILHTGGNDPNCENFGTLTDNGYNLSDDASCGFTGTSADDATLNLSALSVTTTPGQQVHVPGTGSAAIGAIPNGTTIDNNGVTLVCDGTATDQLGSTRPIIGGDACTSGAVEVVPPCVLPATVTTETQLARCINAANANGVGPDTITLGADITLSTILPQIATAITLEGGGFFVSGNNSRRVFYVTNTGNFTVNEITVQNGRTAGSGGGILNEGGTLTVTNSTFSGNFASGNGGGIANFIGSTLIVTNSTFSANSTTIDAGGVFNASGTATVTHSTFSGNSGINAGAILNTNGTVYLAGVVMDTGASGANCSGAMTDNGYNLSDDASCGFSGAGSANNATLNLGALADNGGPTETHALLSGSDAIDAIPYNTPISNNGVSWTCNDLDSFTDQRGVARPQGVACDVGAYEYWGLGITAVTTTDASLDWNSANSSCTYDIFESTTPYFAPTNPATYTTVSLTQALTGKLGIVGTNYFYINRATCGGIITAYSNEVGEFDFAIVPGN